MSAQRRRLAIVAVVFLALGCGHAETPAVSSPVMTVSGNPETAAAATSAASPSAASAFILPAVLPPEMANLLGSSSAAAPAPPVELPNAPSAALASGSGLTSGSGLASDSSPASDANPFSSAGSYGAAMNPVGPQSANGRTPGQAAGGPQAPPLMKYIPPGYSVEEPLSANEKMLLGLRDLYNPLNFAGMFASAGYEHLFNGEPNYGVDRGAFGERLGAAAIRESTQGLFTDAVFSPLLREDPRYYIEGPQFNFFHRTIYAVTRPLITRADSGRNTINGALLLGYAASSGLAYAYYPPINQNFRDTLSTFGGGLGGAALGFFVSEFSSDVLHMLHIGKR